ncbi:MAG: amino acid ABC transporter substrate-binding protein [Prochloraceae cyanobacterium]|nr:amino acid ABC transporter substrate-binding protein [Prochloraceae cyanobacterium]
MKSLFSIPILLTLAVVLAGCNSNISEKSADDVQTIRLGAAVSETGKFAREGKDTRQGYNLWRDWVNEEYGGIKVGDRRYQVEIVYYDDEGKPDTTARLVEKLITEDKVNFLLAPYSSGLTKSASAISEKYGAIMVSGGAAADSLFTRGFKNLFSISPPASNYTESTLKALSEAGAKTVVIAYEDTPFPTNVAEGAKKWAQKYGMKLLATESYPKDVADVSAIMSKFKALNPDVFVGGGHFNDALLFVRSAKELNFNPKAMVITVGPSNPKFVSEIGADANYIFGPTKWERTMKYKGKYFGTTSEYADRYQAKWGEAPPYQAAGATAGALVLHLAIEKAGSLEPDAVRQAMGELNVVTFYGPINFDETGKNTAKPMGSIQIQNGKIQLVAPKDTAVTQNIYPATKWKER